MLKIGTCIILSKLSLAKPCSTLKFNLRRGYYSIAGKGSRFGIRNLGMVTATSIPLTIFPAREKEKHLEQKRPFNLLMSANPLPSRVNTPNDKTDPTAFHGDPSKRIFHPII